MDAEELKQRFGKRVQMLRRQRNMTQERLAEAIDRSTDTVSNIETGRLSTRIDTAMRLAQTLGVSLSELFDIGDPAPAPDPEHRLALERLMQLVEPLDLKVFEALVEINRQIVGLVREYPRGG
jgi:transcriptional regulator with XRE-family HTH domain